MNKAKIKIIIYQENGKTKVRFRNKRYKKASVEVKNLHMVLSNKIRDILNKI